MPGMDVKSSWADEVELDSGTLPPPTETTDEKGNKIVTEYRIKDDKKVKVVRTYKQTKQIVSKSIAKRKMWKKFGDSGNDKPGPNTQTTMVSEDIYMQFVSSREEDKNDPMMDTAKSQFAKCRYCSGDHFTVNCPFKNTASYMEKVQETKQPTAPEPTASTTKSGKYVPPQIRDSQKAGGGRGGGRDDTSAIRISNLSESMVESDLEDLVKKIGPHSKMYLAKDKNTGMCKGFAYVHFRNRSDAATAIEVLNGYGYDHLILNVEWSKPQNN